LIGLGAFGVLSTPGAPVSVAHTSADFVPIFVAQISACFLTAPSAAPLNHCPDFDRRVEMRRTVVD
jgi:hypothetical protein